MKKYKDLDILEMDLKLKSLDKDTWPVYTYTGRKTKLKNILNKHLTFIKTHYAKEPQILAMILYAGPCRLYGL